MKWLSFVVGLFCFLSLPVDAAEGAKMAKATLHDAQGKEVGTAFLTEVETAILTREGVEIILELHDLPSGVHAFHIHSVGKCEGPDFASAGGHFNPYGKKHGMKNPEGAHAGDLQNLSVGEDGTAQAEFVTKEVTLGSGDNSLFHPEGTSVVIHANPDDEMTDPAGNAGARIACGVITE